MSAFQGSYMGGYRARGAVYAIVKATEGTWYKSPSARAQIHSAHMYKMNVHAYHFANFSSSSWKARREAKSFIARAKQLGIAKARYLALDWESENYNYVYGNAKANTNAIITFMDAIKKAGYKAMLYTSASLLKEGYVQGNRIVKRYGDVIWVASYATMGRIDAPNYGYFPSMPGVKIWQFTDDWKGLNVDGNVAFGSLNKANHHVAKPKHKSVPVNTPAKKESGIVYAPIINNNPNWKIALCNANGHVTGKYIRTNTHWKLIAEKMIRGEKFYKLGTDRQWVPAKYLKVIK